MKQNVATAPAPALLPYQNPLSARLGEAFFKGIPRVPGVYLMIGLGGQVIYVGKAKDLRARLTSYRRARPHQVSRKTVRLVHSIDEIRYEACLSEAEALLRENELLRQHRPVFNVVNTDPESYAFIGVRERKNRHIRAIEFRFTTRPEFGPEWAAADFFGAFKGRGRVRDGYQTLLRLLWSTQADLERFAYPGCLTRRKVPHSYEWRLREDATPAETREWLALIQRFFRGTSDALLRHLTERLLFNSSIPPFYYRSIQQDLETLKGFYEMAPARNRRIRARLGLKTQLIAQNELDDLIVLHKLAQHKLAPSIVPGESGEPG